MPQEKRETNSEDPHVNSLQGGIIVSVQKYIRNTLYKPLERFFAPHCHIPKIHW